MVEFMNCSVKVFDVAERIQTVAYTPTGGGPPSWRLGEWLTTSPRKKKKDSLLRNFIRGLGIGRIIWSDLGS